MSPHAQDELGATKGQLVDEQEKLLARETEISDLLRKVTDSEHKVMDSEREAQRLADVEETLALQVLSLGKDSLGLGHPSLPFSLSPPLTSHSARVGRFRRERRLSDCWSVSWRSVPSPPRAVHRV